MPVAAVTTSPPSASDRPAGGAFTLVFTTLPALLRLTCGLVGAVIALAVRTPPVRVALLVPLVAALTAWSVWYAARALRRGVTGPLVAGDVALTTAACLLVPWLVAPEVLPGEGSWIAILASTTVINAQATAPARWSVPAGLLVTAGYVLGTATAGNPVEARAHAATLLVQTGCTALVTAVMRRRIGRADRAFADYQRLARAAVVARAAREAECRQNRDLHDTVLATLTMVGLGAVAGPSAALRDRCAADLRTLAALADARSAPAAGPTALVRPAAGGPRPSARVAGARDAGAVRGPGRGRRGASRERRRRAVQRGPARAGREGHAGPGPGRRRRRGRGRRRRSRLRPGHGPAPPVRPARVDPRPDGRGGRSGGRGDLRPGAGTTIRLGWPGDH